MYKCQLCGEQQKPGAAAHKLPVEWRTKEYPHRNRANRDGTDDPGGKGQEVVKEITICEECITEPAQ